MSLLRNNIYIQTTTTTTTTTTNKSTRCRTVPAIQYKVQTNSYDPYLEIQNLSGAWYEWRIVGSGRARMTLADTAQSDVNMLSTTSNPLPCGATFLKINPPHPYWIPNRPFAWWRHFTATTRILHGLAVLAN